jgi:hypothetical protein
VRGLKAHSTQHAAHRTQHTAHSTQHTAHPLSTQPTFVSRSKMSVVSLQKLHTCSPKVSYRNSSMYKLVHSPPSSASKNWHRSALSGFPDALLPESDPPALLLRSRWRSGVSWLCFPCSFSCSCECCVWCVCYGDYGKCLCYGRMVCVCLPAAAPSLSSCAPKCPAPAAGSRACAASAPPSAPWHFRMFRMTDYSATREGARKQNPLLEHASEHPPPSFGLLVST